MEETYVIFWGYHKVVSFFLTFYVNKLVWQILARTIYHSGAQKINWITTAFEIITGFSFIIKSDRYMWNIMLKHVEGSQQWFIRIAARLKFGTSTGSSEKFGIHGSTPTLWTADGVEVSCAQKWFHVIFFFR